MRARWKRTLMSWYVKGRHAEGQENCRTISLLSRYRNLKAVAFSNSYSVIEKKVGEKHRFHAEARSRGDVSECIPAPRLRASA